MTAATKSTPNIIRKLLRGIEQIQSRLSVLLVVVASFQTISKLWVVNWFQSQEGEKYPVRLVEYVQTFKCGFFFPRWAPDLYGGHGYPLFNYYQPGIFSTAAAIMALFAIPPIAALRLAIALFAVVGGYGAYCLTLGETRRQDAALLAAIVFVYLPYRFVDLFTRGDLSEFAAYSLVPFVFWGFRRLIMAEPNDIPFVGTLAALSLAATVFCHIIMGLYTTEIVGIMLLTTALRRGTNMLRRALLGCCLVVIAIGMTTVYIAPAWFERGLVTIDNVRAPIWSPANNLILPWRLIFDSGFFSVGIAPTLGVIVAATSLAISRVRRNAALLIGWWTPDDHNTAAEIGMD